MFKPAAQWMATALLVVGTLTACTDDRGPTAVEVPLNEIVSAGVVGHSPYSAKLVSTESSELGTVTTAVIDRRGGIINAGRHSLFVPAMAVSRNTEFRMEVLAGPSIIVDLSARSVRGGQQVSVFPIPLFLTLSYESLPSDTDEARLRNVFLFEDSSDYLIPLISWLDTSGKTVSSPITHFSKYGMAIE